MLIMGAVRQLRTAKGWSAERLAAEMTKVGCPWRTDVVVNLEHGRRKSLRVHELVALAWVLNADSPADLIVPEDPKNPLYPVTPSVLLTRESVRAWFRGETGPLRESLTEPREGEPDDLAAVIDHMPPEVREQILMLARSATAGTARIQVVARPEDDTDGQD
jgi:transcriptional regulator with XRE-family HTH domain